MALNTGAADTLANAICTALNITDTAAVAKWKQITEHFYTSLKTDIVITILATSIHTTGTAAAQTGPAANIPLSPA